jgi:hypothetical protein
MPLLGVIFAVMSGVTCAPTSQAGSLLTCTSTVGIELGDVHSVEWLLVPDSQ